MKYKWILLGFDSTLETQEVKISGCDKSMASSAKQKSTRLAIPNQIFSVSLSHLVIL
jgi:hypothetical protein